MMYYEAIDLWNSPNSYLEHHGVKGMKWGVRHDYKPSGRSRLRRNNKKRISERTKLSVKVGLIATAGVLAAVGGVYLYKNGYLNTTNISNAINSSIVKNMVKNMDTGEEITDTLKIAKSMNPNGDTMNCAFTSTGYIFNKITGIKCTAKKYKVNMLGSLTGNDGTTSGFFDLVFDGIKHDKVKGSAKYFVELPTLFSVDKNIKDNSFGIMFIQSPAGFGHYVNYEKKNGITSIIDCQSPLGTGKYINTIREWSKQQWRAIEILDCTNAKLVKNSELYLKKILDM